MKLENQDIGELFRDAFDGFESNVNGNPWTGIESQLQAKGLQSAASGSAGAAGSITGKLLSLPVVAVTSGLIGAGLLYALTADEAPVVEEPVAVVDTQLPEEGTTFQDVNAQPEVETFNINTYVIPRGSTEAERQAAEDENRLAETDVRVVVEDAPAEASPGNQGNNRPNGMWVNTPYGGNGSAVVDAPDQNATANQAGQPSGTTTTPSETENTPEPSGTVSLQPLDDKAPVAAIVANTKGGFAPLTVQLKSAEQGVNHRWDFDENGAVSTGAEVNYTFNEPGVYSVMLEVTGANGLTSTNTINIEVQAGSTFDHEPVPNVFTPNNDGINERFIVPGLYAENLVSVSMHVYTRSGSLIFQTSDLESGWDGINHQTGNASPNGVYGYVIRAVGNDGRKYEVDGTVTLRR